MNADQAGTILQLIESATDGNWPNTVLVMVEERGYHAHQIIDAWKALEKLAGCSGTAPDPGDF